MSSCLCLGVSLGSAAALFPPLLLVVLNVSGVLSLHFPFGTTIASQEVASIVVRSRAPCLLCWWPLRDHGTLAEPRWHECNPQSPDWALQVSGTHVCWVSISHALWIQLHGQDAEQFRLSLLFLAPWLWWRPLFPSSPQSLNHSDTSPNHHSLQSCLLCFM